MGLHLLPTSLLPAAPAVRQQQSPKWAQQAHVAAARGPRSRSRMVSHLAAISDSKLTADGVVSLSPEEAEAERLRLEGTDAFAELVAISSRGGADAAGAAVSGALKKPP